MHLLDNCYLQVLKTEVLNRKPAYKLHGAACNSCPRRTRHLHVVASTLSGLDIGDKRNPVEIENRCYRRSWVLNIPSSSCLRVSSAAGPICTFSNSFLRVL